MTRTNQAKDLIGAIILLVIFFGGILPLLLKALAMLP